MPRACPHCGHETEAETCPLCGSEVAGSSPAGEPPERSAPGRERAGPGEAAGGTDGRARGPGRVAWEDAGVPFPDNLWRSWKASLFAPAAFFRRAAGGSGLARPLLYFLLVTVAGAVFSLLWQYGPAPAPAWEMGGEAPVGPAVGFFVAPFAALVGLAVSTLVFHLGALVLAPDRRGIGATLRVVCYAAGPSVLAAVPVVGGPVGLVWTWVLQVVGLREVHRTGTGRALVMVFWVWGLFLLFLAGMIALALAGGAGEELRRALPAGGWPGAGGGP